jgi:hypothetical protein
MANEQNGKDQQEINLKRYETDVEGLSLDKLEAGLWLAKNRGVLRNILIGALVALIIASWGFSLYGFGSYLLVGMINDSRMMTDLVKSQILDQAQLKQRKARDLIISTVSILPAGGKYDLCVSARNPNEQHRGIFSYCFTVGNGEQSCGQNFILPGETKYVMALAQTFSGAPANASFSIAAMNWNRVDNHLIPNWNQYRDQRLNISVRNPLFKPDESSAAEKLPLNTLSFTAVNHTSFSYWEAPFQIILFSGNRIVGINQYVIKDFVSFDERTEQISWPGIIRAVSKIIITPEINIMDQGVYQQPNE